MGTYLGLKWDEYTLQSGFSVSPTRKYCPNALRTRSQIKYALQPMKNKTKHLKGILKIWEFLTTLKAKHLNQGFESHQPGVNPQMQ